MSTRTLGLLLVACGVALALVGAAVYLGWFHWFGRLPGDVDIDRGNVRIYFPLTSMLVLSLVLTLLVNLLRRLF